LLTFKFKTKKTTAVVSMNTGKILATLFVFSLVLAVLVFQFSLVDDLRRHRLCIIPLYFPIE
jgi:hypothetical protein